MSILLNKSTFKVVHEREGVKKVQNLVHGVFEWPLGCWVVRIASDLKFVPKSISNIEILNIEIHSLFSGFVCKRNSVLSTGCCDKNSTSSLEFSCNGCKNSTGCCATFEFCVSCCMNPVNVSFKKSDKKIQRSQDTLISLKF